MIEIGRRALLLGGASTLGLAVAGCETAPPEATIQPSVPADPRAARRLAALSDEAAPVDPRSFKALYGAVREEPFPVPALPNNLVAPQWWRQDVAYQTNEPPGTIVVDPRAHYLYHVKGGGRARRYGVGVGRQGFSWSGVAAINSKQEWPDWYPPKEMIERQPELKRSVAQLQSGLGVAGGPRNPLGARALYLWQNNKDTLFRIHGTLEPQSIGKSVSSGCIRMVNQDVIDLYNNVAVGAKVVVV